MINRCVIFLPRKKVDFFGKLLNTIIVQKFSKNGNRKEGEGKQEEKEKGRNGRVEG